MLGRNELAAVVTMVGLGLVAIGLLGVGVSTASNTAAVGLGAALAVVGIGWWTAGAPVPQPTRDGLTLRGASPIQSGVPPH